MNTGYSQTGIGTTTPDPSAQLEVSSTEKGILIPRMTEVQKNGIVSPAKGLLIYQIDGATEGFYYFDGSTWISLSTPGPIGPQGPPGLQGPQGDQGPEGPPGSGTIIAFASGGPDTIVAVNNNPFLSSAIGFGNSDDRIIHVGNQVQAINSHLSFSMPRDGTITGFSAYFRFHSDNNNGNIPFSINAQLYQNTTSDNFFSPVNGAIVTLTPAIPGATIPNTVIDGAVDTLNIEVTKGTRLMLVFSLEYEFESQFPTALGMIGFAGGGLAFD